MYVPQRQTISSSAPLESLAEALKHVLSSLQAAHGLSLFLVDAELAGFDKGKNLKKIGLKAQDTSELFFEDCRVPSSALLGEANKGFYYLMEVRAT